MFEAFQESDYRRFWATQFVSNVGSWMQTVAQGWLVYRLTNSAFLLGFVGFASSIPALLLMLPAGALADQFDRKRVVAVSQVVQALSALALALSIYFERLQVWQIVAAALTVGVAQSFSAPAWQAMVVDLLEDRSRLANAIAMNSLQFNLSRAIGPLLAGATLAAWGSFWCFLLNAVSFVPLVWVLYTIGNRQERDENEQPMLERLGAGFRFVRQDRVIVPLVGVVAAASLFGFPYLNLMPVVARRLFTNDAQGIGYLIGAVGIGALSGALLLSIRTPSPSSAIRIILTGLFMFGAGLTAVGMASWIPLVMVLLAVCGFSMVTCLAMCNTTIQRRTPNHMRGRVLAMYTFAFYAFFPFGNLFSGMLTENRGIRFTLVSFGAALVACAGLAAMALRSAAGEGFASSS